MLCIVISTRLQCREHLRLEALTIAASAVNGATFALAAAPAAAFTATGRPRWRDGSSPGPIPPSNGTPGASAPFLRVTVVVHASSSPLFLTRSSVRGTRCRQCHYACSYSIGTVLASGNRSRRRANPR